jgi:hypothetical protein
LSSTDAARIIWGSQSSAHSSFQSLPVLSTRVTLAFLTTMLLQDQTWSSTRACLLFHLWSPSSPTLTQPTINQLLSLLMSQKMKSTYRSRAKFTTLSHALPVSKPTILPVPLVFLMTPLDCQTHREVAVSRSPTIFLVGSGESHVPYPVPL